MVDVLVPVTLGIVVGVLRNVVAGDVRLLLPPVRALPRRVSEGLASVSLVRYLMTALIPCPGRRDRPMEMAAGMLYVLRGWMPSVTRVAFGEKAAPTLSNIVIPPYRPGYGTAIPGFATPCAPWRSLATQDRNAIRVLRSSRTTRVLIPGTDRDTTGTDLAVSGIPLVLQEFTDARWRELHPCCLMFQALTRG